MRINWRGSSGMKVTVITPPEPVVEWAELRKSLRIDSNAEQEFGEHLIAAVTDWLDGPRGWLGRAIGDQTLELRFARFVGDTVALPYGPVQSITSVQYLDDDGAEQSFAGSSYQLLTDDRISVHEDIGWPDVFEDEEAVRIRYVAGYPKDAQGASTVPAAVRGAIIAGAGFLFDNRDASLEQALPMVRALAQKYRNFSP
jgi:uncharacterized phiE125 gp8 family phage protein